MCQRTLRDGLSVEMEGNQDLSRPCNAGLLDASTKSCARHTLATLTMRSGTGSYRVTIPCKESPSMQDSACPLAFNKNWIASLISPASHARSA